MKVMIYIGLDVHNDSIALSLAPSDTTEVRRWGLISGTHEHVHKLLKQLTAAHPQATLKFCYEAGPRGYPLGRFLRGLGHEESVPRGCRGGRATGSRRIGAMRISSRASIARTAQGHPHPGSRG